MRNKKVDIKKEKNWRALWEEFKRDKVPRPLIPIIIFFVELFVLKDFLVKNQKLITIFGVFGAVSVYSAQISPKAAFFSLLLFLVVGILIIIETLRFDRILPIFLSNFIIIGFIIEIYRYIKITYTSYFGELIDTVKFIAGFIIIVLIFSLVGREILHRIRKSTQSKRS